MIGNTYYGIASSFYRNKLSVCVAKKVGAEGELVKVDEKSFIEKDSKKLYEATERFIKTVIEVAQMQAAENYERNSNYPVALILGWPGINECQGMNWLDCSYEDIDYKDPTFHVDHDDKAIRNLRHFIDVNLEGASKQTNIASSAVAISTAIYHSNETMEHDDAYNKEFALLEDLFRKATIDKDKGALLELKKEVAHIASQLARFNVEKYGQERFKLANFENLRDPIYNFFDLPELREEFVRVYKLTGGIPENRKFTLKLPNDGHSDEFFDVLNGEMEELITLYP